LTKLNNKVRLMIWAFIFCFNAFFVFLRSADGLPMGEDAPSHLYKILYALDNYRSTGHLPQWSDLWYSGHPIFLYYPPLSYMLVLAIAFIGVEPVAVYKMADGFFFIIAPLTLYFLARQLKLNEEESLLAAFLFTVTPSVVESYFFFDRYPTTISIPLICLFTIFLKRVMEDGKSRDVSVLALLSALTILIHPLSAYALVLIAGCFAIIHLRKKNLTQISKKLSIAVIGAFLASMFWLLPLIDSLQHQVDNPFVNHSLFINYIDLPHLGHAVFLVGAFQLLASLTLIKQLFFNEIGGGEKRAVVAFSVFLLGSIVAFFSVQLGQILIVIGFTATLFTLLQNKEMGLASREQNLLGCSLWLVVFFWLSLGTNALLIQVLPLWQKLDNMRFFTYASIPLTILAGKYITSIIKKSCIPLSKITNAKLKRRSLVALLCLGIVTSFTLGVIATSLIKATPNTNIPEDVIQHFKGNPGEGRVLPIECPKWIHILPIYTNTPLIDGWFPQAKILKPLLEINDYRINDLIDYPVDERLRIWRNLIGNHTLLGIRWIVIGNASKYHLIEDNPDFTLTFTSNRIRIYETLETIQLVETYPKNAIDNITVTQLNPDRISIETQKIEEYTTVVIKQAYMPYWTATADNDLDVDLRSDAIGYITVLIEPTDGTHVTLSFSYQKWPQLQTISILVLLGLVLAPLFTEAQSRLKKHYEK